MKILTWNINGYRATIKNGMFDQIIDLNPDIICLQEIKCNEEIINHEGYKSYYNFANKKGYSGVCTLTKEEPINVHTEIGEETFDSEGRFLLLEFNDYMVLNLYVINGGKSEEHFSLKLETLSIIINYFKNIDKKIIICTDFNIAHTEIDVYNAKQHFNTIMFTKEEREKVDEIISSGFVDSFRMNSNDDRTYSWWTFKFNARSRNIGWRIDYIFLKDFKSYETTYLMDYMGSDHCPVICNLM